MQAGTYHLLNGGPSGDKNRKTNGRKRKKSKEKKLLPGCPTGKCRGEKNTSTKKKTSRKVSERPAAIRNWGQKKFKKRGNHGKKMPTHGR